MAADKLLNSKFDYGDTVIIKQNAPLCYKPGCIGSICGIRVINSIEIAKRFNQNINSELYLIEFDNGQAIEIPKSFLIPYSSS
ncbi:hypothetical protein [Candidatus Protochlamydia phocaeensis]|uniref:hypothetical protein n=1 Tax=Candidatus Protochlamydia phocaeensis TaxID=1414722 RepID=UPI0008392236|nr:hypothetical protein [Candidatus Protochlamydia phocaeensis]